VSTDPAEQVKMWPLAPAEVRRAQLRGVPGSLERRDLVWVGSKPTCKQNKAMEAKDRTVAAWEGAAESWKCSIS
jgi:hypothetical protein